MGKSKELAELGSVVTNDNGDITLDGALRVNTPADNPMRFTATDGSVGSPTWVYSEYYIEGASGTRTAYIGVNPSKETELGNNNAGTCMRIDQDGRVTMPYQPVFYARNHETGNGWVSGTELYGFYDTLVNIGGHMNTSTGRFTAPVSGTYYLEFSCQEEVYYGQWGDGIYFRIRVNGADKILCGNDTGISDFSSEMFISFGGYVYMNAGDYASVYGDVGGSVISLERYVGGFGGHLIG